MSWSAVWPVRSSNEMTMLVAMALTMQRREESPGHRLVWCPDWSPDSACPPSACSGCPAWRGQCCTDSGPATGPGRWSSSWCRGSWHPDHSTPVTNISWQMACEWWSLAAVVWPDDDAGLELPAQMESALSRLLGQGWAVTRPGSSPGATAGVRPSHYQPTNLRSGFCKMHFLDSILSIQYQENSMKRRSNESI